MKHSWLYYTNKKAWEEYACPHVPKFNSCSMFLFSFTDFIFMFSSFNNFIQFLFFHSKISILYSITGYSRTGCLYNNNIFIQHVFYSIVINSFYNLHFPSVLCCFINFNNFMQKSHIHSKILVSFKNVIYIQKIIFLQRLYIHSTFQFVYTGMEGESTDCMISTYKNRRKATYLSCSLYTKTRNKLKWVELYNQLEQAGTIWNELELLGTRWNCLEQNSATYWHKKKTES